MLSDKNDLPRFDPSRCRCKGDAYSGLISCDYCIEEGPFSYTKGHPGMTVTQVYNRIYTVRGYELLNGREASTPAVRELHPHGNAELAITMLTEASQEWPDLFWTIEWAPVSSEETP